MLDANDARDLIEEAIERADSERDRSESLDKRAARSFRDRVSLLVGVFAVSLAIVHMAAAGSARDSLLKGIEASDTFAYMQAKIVREAIYKTAAKSSTAAAQERSAWAAEAMRLRAPDAAGHGIGQLQTAGAALREDSRHAMMSGEGYELGETALQIAIVLLSVALIAGSYRIVAGACVLGGLGVLAAASTFAGLVLPWAH
jgi:hypothetical protein